MAHTITAVTAAAWVMPFVIQSHKRSTKCLVNDTYRTKAGQICKYTDSVFDLISIFISIVYICDCVFAETSRSRHQMVAQCNRNSRTCQSNMSSNHIQCIHWPQILMVPLAVCQSWTSISHSRNVQLTLADTTTHVAFTTLLDIITHTHCHKRAAQHHDHKHVIRRIPKKAKRSI